MPILYAIVVFLATLIGALFGIGGGVIIKPALEAFSGEPLALINALSGITVLCMAIVSLLRYIGSGQKLDFRVFPLALGAVSGGFAGKYLFDLLLLSLDERAAKCLQYGLLIVMLLVVTQRARFKARDLRGLPVLFAAGLALGTLSAFLGIGGGPLNLLVLYIVIGTEAKRAAVYSVFVILCSQAALVGVTALTGGYAALDLGPLAFMLPAAIAGGLIGPAIHKRLPADRFARSFTVLVWLLVGLNVWNVVKLWV